MIKKAMKAKSLILGFRKEGRRGKKGHVRGRMSRPNLEEEYKQAFRTKSYIDIRNKVTCQLDDISCHFDECLSSSTNIQYLANLSQNLLQTHQKSLDLHLFLANYFEIIHEATRLCGSLLTSIHRARLDYRSLKNVMEFINQSPDCLNWSYDQSQAVYKNLSSFVSRKNPFFQTDPRELQILQGSHVFLLQNLASQCKKTRGGKDRFIRFWKRANVGFMFMVFGALAIVLLALSTHCLVGLVAAPGLGIWALAHFMRKWAKRKSDHKHFEEVVAKGVFVMMNDFDTMSRIMKRLHDEMEHEKFVADICVKKLGEKKMLREVVREFEMHERCLMDLLEELEKEIYLCFLNIDRSKRLVIER